MIEAKYNCNIEGPVLSLLAFKIFNRGAGSERLPAGKYTPLPPPIVQLLGNFKSVLKIGQIKGGSGSKLKRALNGTKNIWTWLP